MNTMIWRTRRDHLKVDCVTEWAIAGIALLL